MSKSIESSPSVYPYSPVISAPPASREVRLPLLPISKLQDPTSPTFYAVSGAVSFKSVQTAPTPFLSPVEFIHHFTLSFPSKGDQRGRKGSFDLFRTHAFGSDADCEANVKIVFIVQPANKTLSISGKYSRLHFSAKLSFCASNESAG